MRIFKDGPGQLSKEQVVALRLRVLAGDESAWQEITKPINKIVKSASKTWQIRGMESSDIQQELLIALYNSMKNFDPERGPWNYWVQMVVRAQLITKLKTAKGAKKKPQNCMYLEEFTNNTGLHHTEDNRQNEWQDYFPSSQEPVSVSMDRRDRQLALLAKLAEQLTGLEMTAIRLYSEGNSYDDILAKMKKAGWKNIRYKTIDNAIVRGKMKARQMLAKDPTLEEDL